MVPEDIIKSIESTLNLNDGRVVKFSREVLAIENTELHGEIDEYSIHVVQIGGFGSRVLTITAQMCTVHGYLPSDDFVSVGFTNGGDLIVGPRKGFEIVSFSSPSGNKIGDDLMPDLCRLILGDKLKNEIVIICKRRD